MSLLYPKARFVPSPNFDERPVDITVDLLVIHNISLPPCKFDNAYIEQFFCNKLNPTEHPYFQTIKDLRVSSHLLIKRTGEVVQFVPFDQRAWHAGVSNFKGRDRCNDFSIGIELEGTDDLPYTNLQYDSLVAITVFLQQYYPAITPDCIVGHSDIAPGRKTDPGEAFDWGAYYSLLEEKSREADAPI